MGARKFNDVFEKFVSWCKSVDTYFVIYAWSGSDFEQITKEMLLKNTIRTDEIEEFLDRWIDFQKDYCELVNVDRLISLEKALNSIGHYFLGDMHDALWDARNTAELFTATRNQEEFFELLSSVQTVLCKEDESRCTLGDMIDFSAICFV